nr:MAG TPA: hypothetical protein [Caudoviricetes sp.]
MYADYTNDLYQSSGFEDIFGKFHCRFLRILKVKIFVASVTGSRRCSFAP